MILTLILLWSVTIALALVVSVWALVTREPAEMKFPGWDTDVLQAMRSDIYRRAQHLGAP